MPHRAHKCDPNGIGLAEMFEWAAREERPRLIRQSGQEGPLWIERDARGNVVQVRWAEALGFPQGPSADVEPALMDRILAQKDLGEGLYGLGTWDHLEAEEERF